MKAQKKTNVLRLLDQAHIAYEAFEYNISDGKTDAVSVAQKLQVPVNTVYKTLVTMSDGPSYFVFIIPAASTLNLKAAAHAAGVKSLEMLPQAKLLPLTGYVHGGCSPIGMKKQFVTTIDQSAADCERIIFSGGKIGYQVEMSLSDLEKVIPFQLADIAE